ncbi:MAG TPA: hypothetical protein VI911_02270, partial [Patescibacteria group bacterium]|nr:hypothetical protein [Patescibacteria group bacterium]
MIGFDADANGTFEFAMNANGSFGIGTTNPQFALDVGGSANVTNLYIGGAQVTASAEELNRLNGSSGTIVDSSSVASHAITSLTAGSGLTGGTGPGAVTLHVGAGNGISLSADDISIDATTTGTTAVTSNNSGLEVVSDGLRLIGGCANGEILKWNSSTSMWYCAADSTGSAGTATIAGSGLATQVAFFSGSTSISGSNNLWWDNSNSRLGVGTSAPAYPLTVLATAPDVTNGHIADVDGTLTSTTNDQQGLK